MMYKIQMSVPIGPSKTQISIPVILSKINDLVYYGIVKENIQHLLDICKSLDLYNKNQYFYNIISDLDQKTILDNFSFDDLYIVEDLNMLKLFLKCI